MSGCTGNRLSVESWESGTCCLLLPLQWDTVDSIRLFSGLMMQLSQPAFLSPVVGWKVGWGGGGKTLAIYLSFLFYFSLTFFSTFSTFPLGNWGHCLQLSQLLSCLHLPFWTCIDFSFPFGNHTLLLSTHCHQNQFVQTNRLITSAAEMRLKLLPTKQIKTRWMKPTNKTLKIMTRMIN